MNVVAELRARFGVGPILRILGVAPSTFYGWLSQQRNPSARRQADDQLLAEITEIHGRSGGTYGSPRIHATLHRRGVAVSRKRVERLMREHGLQGAFLRKQWRTSSTRQNPNADPAPDLVKRDFTAPAPNRLWVADTTRIPCGQGAFWLGRVLQVGTQPQHDRRDDDLRPEVGHPLCVAGGQGSELLEPVEAALDHVALGIEVGVEPRWPAAAGAFDAAAFDLVDPFRAGERDPAPAQGRTG